MQADSELNFTDTAKLTPFSKEWKTEYVNVMLNFGALGQNLMEFYLVSFPRVDLPFLISLEAAADAGDLKVFLEAAERGLPMDRLPQNPVPGGSIQETSVVFAPLNRAIQNGHQDFAVALATGAEFHLLIETHSLSESASDALIAGRQTKTIAALYESARISDKDLLKLTKKIVQSLDLDLLKAAALAGSRFFDMKDESVPQAFVSVLSMALMAGNESVFDVCIQRGQRPWQQKVSGSNISHTAFDRLCQGRSAVLDRYEGTRLDQEDLARRTSIAHKLEGMGFGPSVTNAEGGNAAHAAAVWRTPDLLDVVLTINPDLHKPRNDGFYPLHCVARNVARKTTSAVFSDLVQVFKMHGANMDCRDFKGNNPVETAVSNQMGAALEAMVAGGVPLNSRNNYNKPAIESMLKVGQPMSKPGGFMASCLRAGIDSNTLLSTGKTLMEALLEKPKQWSEAVNTIRAFKARSNALDLIDEIEKELKSVTSPIP